MTNNNEILLQVDNLKTYFHTRTGCFRAVNGVSFHVRKGETLGIVGESGSGKSVSQYSLLKLIPQPPGKIESGTAFFDGTDLLSADEKTLRGIRGKRISMIFQDPMTCLNPYLKIGDQIIEPLLIHHNYNKEEARKKAIEALKQVGMTSPEKRMKGYPHELSGGMRQRVMIAMALITEPELLIADEPTTALDVTVQAQILDLIKKLQKEKNTAVIFITHDLGVIAGVADRVMVMYAGEIVEEGLTEEIFYSACHPYTRALLKSIPANAQVGDELFSIDGLPPNLSHKITGCSFNPRCTEKVNDDKNLDFPTLTEITKSHRVANCACALRNVSEIERNS